ncbi:MAG: hypothetical protein ACOX7F_01355 [Eubacteriales bacterium]
MSRALSKEKKKELLELYQHRQKRLRQADIVAAAGLLALGIGLFFGDAGAMAAAYVAVLVCCVVSVAMVVKYSRCPYCGRFWLRRNTTHCKKCGFQITRWKG